MKRFRHLLRENPQLLWGGFVISVLLLACLVGIFYQYDPVVARNQGIPKNLAPGGWYWLKIAYLKLTGGVVDPKLAEQASQFFWLGTDSSGQSILIRLVKGTEAFFFPGMLASVIAFIGGGLLGAFSGYYGGWLAYIGRYLTTLINSFPNLILVLLCVTVFGPKMMLIAAMVGVTFIPHIAEEIRRKVVQLKAEEFVMAAEAHGLRDLHILFYHIVWLHCFALIVRQLVFLWGYLIILETSLNYLGKGVLQEGSSWGKMLYEYGGDMFGGQYWSPLVVTGVVMFTMSGFYFLAEGLQRWSEGAGRYLHIDVPGSSAEASEGAGR